MNTNRRWQEKVSASFDKAASNYNSSANIQKLTANKLSTLCARSAIDNGLWVDLGSGTGLLAESLENLHPNQRVLRVDISPQMINQQPIGRLKQVWNLNNGLPTWHQKPNLLASSFALHWLISPELRLKEWFGSLAPEGWIALALPIQGSFQEWHQAAHRANVRCTAIALPPPEKLVSLINNNCIRYQKVEVIKQSALTVTELLKPMVNAGAHSSPHKPLNTNEWKKLIRHWPRAKINRNVTLTWLIQLLLIKK